MSLDINKVHEEMLDSIPSRYQKTAGFPAYDFTRAFAVAVLSLDDDMALAEAHQDVDNLNGIDLDDYILQHRGLVRKYGTFAEAIVRVTLGGGEIHAGDMFSTSSGVEFYALEDALVETGDTFRVRAYQAGEIGNVGAGEIKYIPITIPGIGGIVNDGPAVGGLDTESDDAFRDRFYDDMQHPNNGSNKQAYRAWALNTPGVGKVRIFPQAFGKNTVEVCVVDEAGRPCTDEVVQAVQETIDPNRNGDGEGAAPIGSTCVVTTAETLQVDVFARVTLYPGYSMDAVDEAIQRNLAKYISEVAFAENTSYLSAAQIGLKIATTDGVKDYSTLLLNDDTRNVPLGDRQVPMLGVVTIV